jgi:hypothetical protein
MKDLEHFKEETLNGSTAAFYYNLPSQRLKDIFQKAANNYINYAIFLQGYRGHQPDGSSSDSGRLEESNGIQEIRFWWGITEYINYLPFFGSLAYGMSRVIDDTNWHSLYFDSQTGDALSHDISEAASKLNDIGLEHLNNNRFEKAMIYFKNAFHHSANNEYKANQKKVNEKVAQMLCNEGQNLFDRGQFSDAENKFQEAFKMSQMQNEFEKYQQKKERAAAEKEAESLNAQGDDLFQKGMYSQAHDKYKQANRKSSVIDQRRKFEKNMGKCDAKLKATQITMEEKKQFNTSQIGINLFKSLETEGRKCFNEGKNLWNEAWNAEKNERYTEANEKLKTSATFFSKASTFVASNKDYKNWQNACNFKLNANRLFDEGQELQRKLKYEEAKAKIEEAYAKIQQALALSGDTRFTDSITILKKKLKEIRKAENLLNVERDKSIFKELTIEDQGGFVPKTEEEIKIEHVQQVQMIDVKR